MPPSIESYFRQLEAIVGDGKADDEISFDFHWTDYSTGRKVIADIRRMQKEIRILRKKLSTEQTAVRSQYLASKASLGSGAGSVVGGLLFGKRAMGRINSARRDEIRCAQVSAMEPYESMKRLMDRVIAKLDQAKTQIELSDQFQIRPQRATPQSASSPSSTAPSIPKSQERHFFLYLDDQVKGPFSAHQIEGFLSANLADDTTLICAVGQETWCSLFEAPEFSEILNKRTVRQ